MNDDSCDPTPDNPSQQPAPPSDAPPPAPPNPADNLFRPEAYGIKESDPSWGSCMALLGLMFLIVLMLLAAAANAARTPPSGTQSALLGSQAPAAGATGAPQSVPPTDTPQPVSELPQVAVPVSAPTPTPARPTPEQTPTPESTPVPTHASTPPPATEPPTPPPTQAPPQTCVATTITVTEGGSTETVTGSGSSTNRSFHFSMTGTQVTIHADDNPKCSPPHYKVSYSTTDGTHGFNCGLPSSSDTTTFSDNSPGEEADVTISQVAQCS